MPGMDNVNAGYTKNQELRSTDGTRYGGLRSHQITRIYEEIYARRAVETGFTLIEAPYNRLTSEHFFDAVHLTPLGGEVIGKYLYEKIAK